MFYQITKLYLLSSGDVSQRIKQLNDSVTGGCLTKHVTDLSREERFYLLHMRRGTEIRFDFYVKYEI